MPLRRLEAIRSAAVALVAAAFTVLLENHVLPVTTFHPYLRVGRDYYGPDVMSLAEYATFDQVLTEAYPKRFTGPPTLDKEFTNAYAFSLIEACIARLALSGEPLDATSSTVEQCLVELIDLLETKDHEILGCRLVSHLTTVSGEPTDVAAMRIIPITEPGQIDRELARALPGALSAFNRERPHAYDPPQALVVASASGANPYAASTAASSAIDRFLLVLRLLYASTGESFYEVTGERRLVRRLNPSLTAFGKDNMVFLRRTTSLAPSDGAPIESAVRVLDELHVERTGMIVTSFDLGLLKFTTSYSQRPSYDQLVDLSTALEAMLSGQDKMDVLLRIRQRASTLLAAPNDAAASIFRDIGTLERFMTFDLASSTVAASS